MDNMYLFLAYGAVWLIFMLYVWSLSRRQARLKKELDELKPRLQEPPSTNSRTS